MVNLLKKVALLSVVLLYGQIGSSEEMLWCSGDRAHIAHLRGIERCAVTAK